MNVAFIIYPLRLSFKKLVKLNHVLPVGVISRSTEGFRALVHVNVHLPLVQGYPCNALQNGDVWVSFKYNNLSGLYCTTCFRLGHVRTNCTFPPTNEVLDTHPTPSTTMSFKDICRWWYGLMKHVTFRHQEIDNSVIHRNHLLGLAINSAYSTHGAHDWSDLGLFSQQDYEAHEAGLTRNLSPLTINEGTSPQVLYHPPLPPPISNATMVASTPHSFKRGRKLGSKNKNPKRVKIFNENQSIQNKPDLTLSGRGKKTQA
ncbi:hypothetical protein FRX31_030809 [Thalictrum thalictroides]|uniref:Uncharacterized protein n=1 Tax=Thalictrum thalictroides TaxID=46969 RepID=A0A7J6V3X5_THATH|nr:hypothetical protein FRX31_030809 [Thalictrum thalictroides]